MSKSLLIVESPTKARTLSRYLGEEYVVKASMGHVKDLPRHKMGVDVDGDFTPEYLVIEGKHKVINELKKAAKGVENIYLAPDPDREGEAIAWHIAEILENDDRKLHRVLFNEITKKGIQEGLRHPLPLDKAKFESQQARRILDRLVGYEISPILWKKVKGGLSAGRVQSVALRMIVDRENAIREFNPKEYWHVFCNLERGDNGEASRFRAQLTHIDEKKASVSNEKDATGVRTDLEGAAYSVKAVKQTERRRKPPAPYITSKLQQEATRRLRMTARKVMQVAQQLYEGVDLGDQGRVGLITYMRTDSTRLAAEAVEECRGYISEHFGAKDLPRKPNVYPQKKSAQGAHEAIRPTSVSYTPAKLKQNLTRDQNALYTLIWNRFVACQMRPAIYTAMQVRISAVPAGEGGRSYELRVTGSNLKYPGWLAVEAEKPRKKKDAAEEENGAKSVGDDGLKVEALPDLAKGDDLKLCEPGVEADQKFTKPPPRFSEGSLIKELEEQGIGRPSTYASIISTIQDRRYVKKYQQRFMPSPLGEIVIDRLAAHFPDVLDIDFTARMEEKLDAIEAGKVEWSQLLQEFYGPFHETVLLAMRNMKTGVDSKEYEKFSNKGGGPAQQIDTDLQCPKCEKTMVLRSGRYGEFLSCSGFPKCRESAPVHTGTSCPMKGCEGTISERRTKRGRKFYGCSKYDETGCEFVTWSKPVQKKCPKCNADFVTIKRSKGATFLSCIAEGCDFSEEIAL